MVFRLFTNVQGYLANDNYNYIEVNWHQSTDQSIILFRNKKLIHRLLFYHFQEDNGFEFFNTIVLQPHLKLVTDMGRGYHVRCRYKSREAAAAAKIVPNDDQTPEALTDDSNETGKSEETTKINDDNDVDGGDRREHGRALGEKSRLTSNEIPMPACHMKIYSGETIAENVKIGDPLTLKISIDAREYYGLHVMDCTVRDGLGWGEQNLVKFG